MTHSHLTELTFMSLRVHKKMISPLNSG